MGKMKRVISFMVVLSMVFSLIVPAISFGVTDIQGTKYEDAIEKLIALDTVKGYEDGTFRPNNNITRAELATIITFVLGLQDAADLAKTTQPRFSDVKVNEWYTGYINIAANENVFVGYPDGTFKPNQEVSYAEAATMLVNALGLKQVVDRSGGSWPSNYMSKASQLGITKGIVGVSGSDSAIRGDIALMAWETLLQDQWGPIGFNDKGEITYGNLNKKLIEAKYPDFVYETAAGKIEPKYFEDVKVIGTPAIDSSLEENQIKIEMDDIAALLKITRTAASDEEAYKIDADTIVVIIPDGTNTSNLLGREINVFFGKDNKVVYLKAVSDENQGIVETIKPSTSEVKIDGQYYKLTSDAKLYINNIEINDSIVADTTTAGKLTFLSTLNTSLNKPVIKANMLMNSSNKVTSLQLNISGTFTIETLAGADSDHVFTQFVVKDIRSDSSVVGLDGTRHFKIRDIDEIDSKVLVSKNGSAAKAEDIEIGNVIMMAENPADEITNIIITDNMITGTLDKISSNYQITVDGVNYKQAIDAKLSTTNDMEDTASLSSDIATLMDTEITIHLDSNGSYSLIMGDSDVTLAGQYGIVARTPIASDIMYDDNGDPYLKLQIINENGNKVGFTVSGKTADEFKQVSGADIDAVDPGAGNDWTDSMLTDFTKGTFIKYSTESDGRTIKVKNLTKLENTLVAPALAEMDNNNNVLSKLTIADANGVTKNSNKSFKDSSNKTYYVTDNTIILNQHGEKLERISGWETLVNNVDADVNMLRGTTPLAIFNSSTRIVKYLIINDDGAKYQATEDKYGIILDILAGTNDSGDKVWMVEIFSEGEATTYEIADISTALDTVLFGQEGDLIRFNVKDGIFEQTGASDIKIDMEAWLDDEDFDGFIVDGTPDRDQLTVDQVMGSLVVFKKVDGTAIEPISISDDVIVYDVSDNAPIMSNMNEIAGRTIMYFDTDGDASEYEIIIILD